MMTEKICGKCAHHEKCTWQYPIEWYCDNKDSDFYTDYTGYSDTCKDWEQRDK